MTKNVTLRMDEKFLTELRHRAVDEHMSLSAWIVKVLEQTIHAEEDRAEAKKRALKRLKKGMKLGGKALSRGQAHAR